MNETMTPTRNTIVAVDSYSQKRHQSTPLLVSDFCQRSKQQSFLLHRNRRNRLNRRKNLECDDNSCCKCTQRDIISNEVQIDVNILRSLPCLPSPLFQNETNSIDDTTTAINSYNTFNNISCNNELNRSDIDTFATVYTRDVELLHKLQIFDGQICFLWGKFQLDLLVSDDVTTSTSATDRSQNRNMSNHHTFCNQQRDRNRTYHSSQIPIILKVLPMDYQLDVMTKNDNDLHHQVYVPPTVAGSIGLYVTTLNSTQQSTIYISPTLKFNNNNNNNIPLATKATIIEIGKHPMDYIMTFDDLYNVSLKENQQRYNDEAIKEFFYDWKCMNMNSIKDSNNSKKVKKIDAYRLVRIGTIFATLSSTHNSDNNGMIRFYKVTDLECINNDKQQFYSQHDMVCWLSPKTKLTLVHNKNEDEYSKTDSDRGAMSKINYTTFNRLPQASLVKTFIKSVRLCHEGKMSDVQKLLDDDTINDSERFLLDDLSKEILSISSDPSYTYGSQRILASHMLHVIRSGEQELKQSLDYTADKRKFRVSFSFQQRLYFKSINSILHMSFSGYEYSSY